MFSTGIQTGFFSSYSGTSLTDDEDDDIMMLIISSFKVGERFSL